MIKKKKILLLIVGLMILSTSTVLANTFSDVPKEYWGYKAITETTKLGITNGYPNGIFIPEGKVTRAEFSKMLVEALNLKGKSKLYFEDVTEDFWGYEYVEIASNYLEAKQSGDKLYFNPDTPAVREDMAVAIIKAMKLENKKYSMNKLNKFSDSGDISEDIQKYVVIASENKLMVGNANGTFNPQGTLTRAEAAQLILNLLDYKEESKKSSGGRRPSTNIETITYAYEWQDIDGSVIGQSRLYIKNSKGDYVSGTLKLTTLSGVTITENVTANGSENIYIKSAISLVEIDEIN